MSPPAEPPGARIALTGYYGQGNFGDDLMLAAAWAGAQRRWPGAQVAVVSPPVAGAPADARFAVPAGGLGAWFGRPGPRGRVARTWFRMRAALSAEMVCYAGGSVLSGSRRPTSQWSYAVLAATRGLRLGGVGLSIGPFPDGAAAARVRRLLARFEFLAVRDRRSHELVRGWDLPYEPRLAADLAAALPAPRGVPGPVGVAVTGHLGDPAAVAAAVGAVCGSLGAGVRLLVLNDDQERGDWPATQKLRRALPELPVEILARADRTAHGLWAAIAGCSVVLSMRLHGGIAAYLSGVPFVLVEYHPKCADFLDDVGHPAELRPRRLAAAPLAEALAAAASGLAPSLPPAAYSARAEANFATPGA